MNKAILKQRAIFAIKAGAEYLLMMLANFLALLGQNTPLLIFRLFILEFALVLCGIRIKRKFPRSNIENIGIICTNIFMQLLIILQLIWM